MTLPVLHASRPFAEATPDFRFAAWVAAFGLLLRDSPHKGDLSYAQVAESARHAVGRDPHGHRAEFVRLVEGAQRLSPDARPTPVTALRRLKKGLFR
jgi:Ca-activated chloride channel family protein